MPDIRTLCGAGVLTGRLPDAAQLCGRLASDCSRPTRLLYTVTECGRQEVEHQSEYRAPPRGNPATPPSRPRPQYVGSIHQLHKRHAYDPFQLGDGIQKVSSAASTSPPTTAASSSRAGRNSRPTRRTYFPVREDNSPTSSAPPTAPPTWPAIQNTTVVVPTTVITTAVRISKRPATQQPRPQQETRASHRTTPRFRPTANSQYSQGQFQSQNQGQSQGQGQQLPVAVTSGPFYSDPDLRVEHSRPGGAGLAVGQGSHGVGRARLGSQDRTFSLLSPTT